MMDYIQISINVEPVQSDILIAFLNEAGYESFMEEENSLLAYIPANVYDEEILKKILSPTGLSFTSTYIHSKNWNEEWERNFQPVVIDNFCCVRGNFHPPSKDVLHDIIITPKMSFGTGHHATTVAMIRMMSDIDFQNKSVIDFGTGTGILAILASRMGAIKVTAIDIDSWSIENAKENALINNCDIEILQASAINKYDAFDVILANINKNVLINQVVAMKAGLKRGGCIIMSGILLSDDQEMVTITTSFGLETVKKIFEKEWMAMQLIGTVI